MRSRSFQVFNVIFKERYREPTLELTLPTMLISNIFITAFYERSNFQLLGIVLAFIPLISVSETLAFALSLRNIIFVTGDHISRGSIASFLIMPIRREKLFLFMYFCDVILPYLFWLLNTEIYLLLSNIQVDPLILLTYTMGFFFTENLILTITLYFKSTGITTIISLFLIGILFIFGGALEYYELLYNHYYALYFSSFANPYVPWIFETVGTINLLPQIFSGIILDGIISIVLLIISFVKFTRLEI